MLHGAGHAVLHASRRPLLEARSYDQVTGKKVEVEVVPLGPDGQEVKDSGALIPPGQTTVGVTTPTTGTSYLRGGAGRGSPTSW